MFWKHPTPFILLGLLVFTITPAHAAPSLPPPVRKPVDFTRDVYPLLRAHCFRCHKGSQPSSGKRLDLRSTWLGESDGLPLAKVGASTDSRVIHLVSGTLPDEVMPPRAEGP